MIKVLVVGESWTTTSIHTKGFDSFITVDYAEGGQALLDSLEKSGFLVTYMPSNIAVNKFPSTLIEMNKFNVILFSDIGSNSILLRPETFIKGQTSINRLDLIRDWVFAGGGFGMIGGYLSFQGIEAKANYRNTSIADVLPVEMEIGDDRQETPQGAIVTLNETHKITNGIKADFPKLLGFQRLIPKKGATVIATIDEYPLLAVTEFGKGRSLAYASDIGPHWAPSEFTSSEPFNQIWKGSVEWLANATKL